jgi:hypothetical protein
MKYRDKIDNYYRAMSQQRDAKETYKRERFLMLLSELFPEEREALERYVEGSETGIVVQTKPGKGSIDAYYGNLVIEFERDLGIKAKYEEGARQIREYVSGLWNEEGRNKRAYIDRHFFRENRLKPSTDAFKNDFGRWRE